MPSAGEVRFQINLEEDEDEDEEEGGSRADGGASLRIPLTSSAATPSSAGSACTSSAASSQKPARRLRVEFVGMEDLESKNQRAEVDRDIKRMRGKAGGPGLGNHSRLHQPRMSLLGKPLNYRAHRRDVRYRRAQAKIYNFLERPKDWRAISYHLLV